MATPLEKRIGRALRRLARRNYGRVGKIETQLGYRLGYLSEIARGIRRAGGKRFEKALKLLGADPIDFFRRATAEVDVETLLEDTLPKRPKGSRYLSSLKQVARAIDWRPCERTPIPELSPEDGATRSVEARVRRLSDGPTASHTLAAIEALDDHRHHKPWEAARSAQKLATQIVPRLEAVHRPEAFCRAVGVLASAQLLAGEMDRAAQTLLVALPYSYSFGPRLEADLSIRAAYILKDCTRFESAVTVADHSVSLWVHQHDELGLAKASIDRSILLYFASDLPQAARELETWLPRIPAHLHRYRRAGLQILSTARLQQGRLQEAERYLDEAEACLEAGASYDRLALMATRTEIARTQGDLQTAEELCREVRELLHDFNPLDVALVTLDLIQILLETQQDAAARQEVVGIGALLKPLDHFPAAQLALMDLVRTGAEHLDHRLLNKARRAVRKERARAGYSPSKSSSKRRRKTPKVQFV